MLSRPFITPSENSSGRRSSMPGTPLAISLKVVASPLGSLPEVSKRYGAWSDEYTPSVPSFRPAHTAS
ncbi:hypothetical protein D3C71_1640910 [compost metagenome]